MTATVREPFGPRWSVAGHGSTPLQSQVLVCYDHIRGIYVKLQVSDRCSAVQRARKLRLLAEAR